MKSLVKIFFRLEQDVDGYPPVAEESVWAVRSGRPAEFVLENIPFFATEATLGDTIIAAEEDGVLRFVRGVCNSGNSLVRVVFFRIDEWERVSHELKDIGCESEYLATHQLLAVSVPSSTPLAHVQAYLEAASRQNILDYEEPILRQ